MPRSSRHKSHKQSKHSSKDDRERSDSEEDVKMKEKNGKEEGSARVSRDSISGEKRKVASQSRDGKSLTAHGNGDTSEEHGASKRRKEKAEGASGSDRWNGGGDERGDGINIDKSSRLESDKSSKSKGLVDSKSKSSRRNDNVGEKKEENLSVAFAKEEVKSSSIVDPKRKSERDSGGKENHQSKDSKETKDKDRGVERERKTEDIKRDAEARVVDSEVARKQGSQTIDVGDHDKRGRENTEWSIHAEVRNPELEKELEKRIRKRRDGSIDKDTYQDHAKEGDNRRFSSRGERGKDGRYKDEKHKDEIHGDKYQEDGDKDSRHRDSKYREDGDRDNRKRDEKHREDGGKDSKRREDRYRQDGGKDSKQRDDKYVEDGERDIRRKDDKYRDDGDRDSRHGDDKYREDGDRDSRRRDDRYREDGDSYARHRDDKYREDSDRDNRNRDDKYWKEGDRDNRRKEDKRQEDVERDNRHRDGKRRDDNDRDKRLRDVKYWDERTLKDRASDKSDNKRSKGESNVGELHYRKSSNQDGSSPIYDDRNTRYKDDKGKRRANEREDKDDYIDSRYQSTKEQRSDAEKRAVNSAKIESVTDRGRSYSRNADQEITLNHNRQRSSPASGSHAAKDHYRHPKQEGSKYWDNVHEEKTWRDVTSTKEFAGATGITEKVSMSRSVEKQTLKEDSYLDELSVERRQKLVSRASPLHPVDKFPSSSSTGRRNSSKSEVRRSLDVEEPGQRIGGFKDSKEYSDEEGRGSRELPTETLQVDELSQVDGDTLSVSSPFSRSSRLPNNSKSHFRYGSLEDENRGRSINRNRRFGDSNMGRAQGSPWKGVPNWPSPMANGFMPFQHGPPPLGFHPVMQQFQAPPMFGVRPPMELNHTGVPYHIADADRFSGHGRPLGWRNPVDDSCPPRPLHGWDSNNAAFGDESHMYGRPDWDQSRTPTSARGWETSGDTWKGQNSNLITDLAVAPKKQDYSAREPLDEVWTDQPGQQAQSEPNQPSVQAEKIEDVEFNTSEAPITVPEKNSKISKTSRKDDARLWCVYLTKLDISADLTQPDLYNQCASLMDVDQNRNSDEVDSKIFYAEDAVDAKVTVLNKTSNTSLFTAINDSVFQKAMSLYKKQREEIRAINGDKSPFSNDDKPGEIDAACDQLLEKTEAESPIAANDTADLSKSIIKLEVSPKTTDQEAVDEPVQPNISEKSEGPTKMEAKTVLNQEGLECSIADKTLSPEKVLQSANSNEEEHISVETKCGPLLFSDVSSEDVVMSESIESGLVNLSRIHHSPESTH